MHILLATLGSAGDVYPLISVGRALNQRGHQVLMVANAFFEATVKRAGLNFIELGTRESYQAISSEPDLWHPQKAFKVIATHFILPLIRPLFKIIARYDPVETILAATGLCFGARIAQEKLGFRLVTLHLQPLLLQSAYQAPRIGGLALPAWLTPTLKRMIFKSIDALVTDPVLGPPTNAFRAELGLPPVQRIFSAWIHSPDRVIGMFPDWFAPQQPDWPPNVLLAGFVGDDGGDKQELPAEIVDFLEAGDPPIVFTPGTAMQYAQEFFGESMWACRSLRCRGLFVTRHREHLPASLLDTIRHVEYAPFEALLPRSSALVHHGGVGTLAQALKAGIPQLVMPMSHDQPDNAARLKHLGVAEWLKPSAYRGSTVARRLRFLLYSPQVRTQCQLIKQKMDFERAREATCLTIEQFAEQKAGG